MPEWPTELLQKSFAPREVADLTGVDGPRQRLIANRHFDFRESIKPTGAHRGWSWVGVQTLTVFEEAMEDLRDADRALAVARGTDANDDRSLYYNFDGRDEDEDTLILLHLAGSTLAGDSISTPKGLANLYQFKNTGARPSRVYACNLSDVQRRLCAKLGLN